jgi:hypothetical protein
LKQKLLTGLAFFILASCSNIVSEQEPNNKAESAQDIVLPAEAEGKLDNGMDEDLYRFQVNEADYYSFSVTGLKGFDVMLEILDQEGRLIKKGDDYFKNFGESIPNLYLGEGSYYLRVSPGMNDHKIGRPVVVASEPYQLKVEKLKYLLKQQNLNFEKENNDSFKTAQEIGENEKIRGYFFPILNLSYKTNAMKAVLEKVKGQMQKDFMDKDLDVYSFFVSNKGVYNLHLEVSAVEDFDSTLIVVDQRYLDFLELPAEAKAMVKPESRGNFFVVDSHAFDRGEGVANYRIDGNTKYYIIVGAVNRLNYQPLKKRITSTYEISYQIRELTSDMESEPNNSFETAKKIETNVIRGYLNPTSDKDYYVFEGDEESFYRLDFKETNLNTRIVRIFKMARVSLNPPSDIDLALDIYGENIQGNDIVLLKTIDNHGKGETEEIPNLLLALQKKMYFVVRGGGLNDGDNYTLPYELKLYFVEKENEEIEHEPNDTASYKFNEGPNTFTENMKAYVNSKGDTDNFYTLIQDRGKYRFQLKPLEGATFVMELYDSNSYFIRKETAKGVGKEIILETFIPRRQVLNLKVYVEEKNFFNVETPYSISVTKVES